MRRFKSQERRDKSQKVRLASRSFSGSRLSTLNSRPFRGFTLIELLVVMFIITILASLILGVAALAAQTAKENSSRHTVERLHTLLTEYYGTYKTRRVNVRSDITGQMLTRNFSNNPPARGQATAEARLYALREMMLMEIPDRWSDVALAAVTGANSIGDPLYLDAPAIQYNGATWHRTELGNVYLRRYQALWGRTNTITGQKNTAADIKQNQSAECLYMVITLACGEGEARAQFGEHSIGDTDGDGAPEFLDGWGHPISFLRWAPGFESQIEINANDIGSSPSKPDLSRIAKDHDPFDVFRIDQVAFRLVPLIYSPGRDESTGIYDAPDFVTWPPASTNVGLNNSNPPPYFTPQLSPYRTANDGGTPAHTAYLGTSMHVVDSSIDETSTDNVHNHLMGQR